MRQRTPAVLAIGGLVAFAIVGVYGYRRYMAAHDLVVIAAPPANATADMNASPTHESTAPLRGPITIDPRRQQLIGVRVVPVSREVIGSLIRATGNVTYDETKQQDVNIKVEGWIRQLFVDATGQPVIQGQQLFSLYSPDLLNAQREYVLALTTRDQMKDSPVPDVHQRADAMVTAARQRLTLRDVSDDDIRALETSRQASDSIVFRSPATGVVVEKRAVAGMHVMPGDSLYKVAGLDDVWVDADVYEADIASVRPGVAATVTLDAYPGEAFPARIVYIYPYLDEKTRTNTVRLELTNGSGRLKPGMYAHVDMKITNGTGLVVPTDAVLDSGTEQLVFVSEGDGVFRPRRVKAGRRLDEKTEIVDGLRDGDLVATGATFFLDSESQLRASLQSYEPTAMVAMPAAGATPLDIALHIQPDPPKMGDNQLEVVVRDGGKPLDGADVRVQFFMPAMPTMSMPAMHSEATLTPAGGGTYRGAGHILMSGKWDTTVTVSKAGQKLGSRQVAVVTQ
jgi:RND family efflux transporter MFP subunit